jgi:hypothetical protein
MGGWLALRVGSTSHRAKPEPRLHHDAPIQDEKMLAKGYVMVRNLKFNLMNMGSKEQLIVGIIAGLRLKNDLFP